MPVSAEKGASRGKECLLTSTKFTYFTAVYSLCDLCQPLPSIFHSDKMMEQNRTEYSDISVERDLQ